MEKSNIFDALAIQRTFLEKTGCWPKRKKSIVYRIRQIISWTIDLTFFFTLCMEMNLNLKENDYKHLTELISFMASPASYLLKHFIFVLKANNFLDSLDRLKSPIFKEYPHQCDHHIKTSIKYATAIMKTYQALVCSLVVMYFLKPFFTKDKLAVRFEVYPLGNWWFVYHCFQVGSIGWACWNNSSLDITALGLISIGAAQFQILRDKLLNTRHWAGLSYEQIENGACSNVEEMREDIEDRQVKRRLKECVRHHYEIIQYCAEIENIYCYYFLIQFIDSVIAICNTWFQFKLATDLLNIVFLVFYSAVLMIQLGIYCFYGNNLTIKSEEIKDSCYMSDWYNCGLSVRKSLMIIMERSKRPTVLTAGKFSVLGLASYSSLLQSAYSYFALMNRLNGE